MWQWADISAIVTVDVDEDPPCLGGHFASFLMSKLAAAGAGVEGEVIATTFRGARCADVVFESVTLHLCEEPTMDMGNPGAAHLEGGAVNFGAPGSAADAVPSFEEKCLLA